MNLKERIVKERAFVNNERHIYAETCLQAERKLNSSIGDILRRHREILDTFKSIKNLEIEKEHDCNCCSPRLFDDSWFTDDGITLRMDADHPYDIIINEYSWGEVEKVLSKVEENKG